MSDDHGWGAPATVRGGRPRLADRAYEAIRDDLIALRIEPGAPLDERQLSASLNVGLTPVRDAIKRLTLERLLVTYPRRGTFAAEINISDERWLTEARTGLEGLAALLAAERATEADRATLIELNRKLEASSSATTSAVGASMDDAAVHRAIYAAAHNPYLETTLNQYANAALRIWHYAIRSLGSHHAHPLRSGGSHCRDHCARRRASARGSRSPPAKLLSGGPAPAAARSAGAEAGPLSLKGEGDHGRRTESSDSNHSWVSRGSWSSGICAPASIADVGTLASDSGTDTSTSPCSAIDHVR